MPVFEPPLPLSALDNIAGADEWFIDRSNRWPGGWRVYHDPCATDVFENTAGLDLESVFIHILAHECPTVSPVEALDYAVFAINNHTDPDAATNEDVAQMERDSTAAIAALLRLREYVVASGEDLPDWVSGQGGEPGAVPAPVQFSARPVTELPLSHFAVHFGLVPTDDEPTRPAGLWVDRALRFGKDDNDLAIRDFPGLYMAGTWTEWGEVSETDPTTHLVYRLEASDVKDFEAIMAGVWAYINRHKGWGRFCESAIISDDDDWAEQKATVFVGDNRQLGIVVPRDWRTR